MKLLLLLVCVSIIPFAFSRAQNVPVSTVQDPPGDHVPLLSGPTIISRPELEFPPLALQAGVSATIYIRGVVNREGIPIKTEILRRDPEMAYMLDGASRRFFMECRFSPAIDSSGKTVSVWMTIPIKFAIQGFTPPVCVELQTPEYPPEALAQGLEGWVGIAVLVDEKGSASAGQGMIVAHYPPEVGIFDMPATHAVMASKYTPAFSGKGPTVGWCFVKVPFAIKMR